MDDVSSNSETFLPQFLQRMRIKHGLKRSKIAQNLGLNLETVRLWETGKNGIPIERAKQVAETYQLTDEEKKEFEQLVLAPKNPFKISVQVCALEYQAFCCLISLSEDARQRVLKAANAYLSAERS